MVVSSGTVTSQAVTLASGVTSGNLLVATVSTGANNTVITAPTGWTQAVLNNPTSTSNNCDSGIWYAVVGSGGVTAGTTSFTFTLNTAHTALIDLIEMNSTTGWPASPLDVTAVGNAAGGQGTSITSGTTATTAQAVEAWVATFSYDGAPQTESSLTSGWTRDNEVHDSGNVHTALMCYKIASSTGTAACSFTIGTTEYWAGAIATFKPNASTATNVSASGGSKAFLLLNSWAAQNASLSTTMTTSDAGGLVFNEVDAQDFYELVVYDASAPTTPNTLQVYKTVSGTRSTLGASAAIVFTRGTSHTVALSTNNAGGTATITVTFDGTLTLTTTDSTAPLGSGQVGLRNDTVSGHSSSIYTAFSATSNDIAGLQTSIPAHNYLQNNGFVFAGGGWSEAGSVTGCITFPASGTYVNAKATLTFSNTAVGTALQAHAINTQYIVIGQQYCFSASVNVTSALSNASAVLEILFQNAVGATILTAASTAITSTSGTQRFSVTGTCPANTVAIKAVFGGTTTNATNSGTVTFASLQCEPVWFPNLYSYPTPICDFLQSDSVTIPDGTSTRFDRIFTGLITHLTATYYGTTRIWDVECSAADTLLETSALINASYANITDLSIIQGIINNLPNSPLYASSPALQAAAPLALAYRNVPNCIAGVTISAIQFADATIREVMNALADITGFTYGVDAYYNTYYYPPYYNQCLSQFAQTPDNVTTFPYYDYSIEYDGTQLHNAVRVVGTTFPTTVTETWNAQDGSHTEGVTGGKTYLFVLLHSGIADPCHRQDRRRNHLLRRGYRYRLWWLAEHL